MSNSSSYVLHMAQFFSAIPRTIDEISGGHPPAMHRESTLCLRARISEKPDGYHVVLVKRTQP